MHDKIHKKYTQKYQARKKTVKLYRPWWSTVIVCVGSTRHIAPQMGLDRQRQRQITKSFFFFYGDGNWRQAEAWNVLLAGAVEVNVLAQGALRQFTQWLRIEHPTFQLGGGHLNHCAIAAPKRFNSKQRDSSVRYMKNKQSEVSQDGWRREQNNAAQGIYRKHKNHAEDNKAHRKHRHSEGDGYSLRRGKWPAEHWLMHWGWLKSHQTCTQANMLAVFSLTTARDRRWWSHCPSLGSPEMSTNFFAKQLKKGAVDLPYTPVVSIAIGWK